MDMYQKRKMRQEKKNNDSQESFSKVSISWYPGHMAKAKRLISENIDLIDVVYEVVDSRIPYSSVVQEIDNLLKNKPRIMIMTKSDLCDKTETNKWIKYYEQNGKKVILVDLEHSFDTKKIINLTEEVMMPINEKREKKGLIKRRARVLIIGIPNVGKSTLINRLVGKKAVNVGNMPGVTKDLNWIRINSDIELLDTPGILWPKLEQTKVAYNLASLTAIKEEILPLFQVVEYILKTLYKYYPKVLKDRYGLDEIDEYDITNTLDIIGKRRGCLIKGGEIDYDKVYAVILNDIKNGIIKGVTFDRYDEYEG